MTPFPSVVTYRNLTPVSDAIDMIDMNLSIFLVFTVSYSNNIRGIVTTQSMGEKMESTTCDYDTSRGFLASEGLGCLNGIPTHEVEITYYPRTKPDVLLLCDDCFNRVRTLARRHGYKVREIKCKLKEGCGNSHNCNIKVCRENKLRIALSTKGDF